MGAALFGGMATQHVIQAGVGPLAEKMDVLLVLE
jgi:hypothetical protein